MAWLLDTCAISELVKPEPDRGVLAWFAQAQQDDQYLSVLTMGELERGILRLPGGKRKTALRQFMNQLLHHYQDRILSLESGALRQWAAESVRLEQQGQTVPLFDALLAATAQCHRLKVVTRNVKHFQPFHVAVENPWLNQ